MGEHPYRPLPPPPRMRWAVECAAFRFNLLGWVVGLSLTWFAHERIERMPWWQVGVLMAVCFVVARWRLVRVPVPVEPPRVRVAETDTLEEHRDLTDAGYVYDHEARVYRLDAHEGGWGPQSNGVHGYTRWDKGELP